MFGSEGEIKIFKSKDVDEISLHNPRGVKDNLPTAKITLQNLSH